MSTEFEPVCSVRVTHAMIKENKCTSGNAGCDSGRVEFRSDAHTINFSDMDLNNSFSVTNEDHYHGGGKERFLMMKLPTPIPTRITVAPIDRPFDSVEVDNKDMGYMTISVKQESDINGLKQGLLGNINICRQLKDLGAL